MESSRTELLFDKNEESSDKIISDLGVSLVGSNTLQEGGDGKTENSVKSERVVRTLA